MLTLAPEALAVVLLGRIATVQGIGEGEHRKPARLLVFLGQAPYTVYGWSIALLLWGIFTILVGYAHKFFGGSPYSLPWVVVIAECVVTAAIMGYFAACFLAWLGLEKDRKAQIIAANRAANRQWKNSLYFHLAAIIVVAFTFSFSLLSLQVAVPDLLLVDGAPGSEAALAGYIGDLTMFGWGYEIAEHVFGMSVAVAKPNPKYLTFWAYSKAYSSYFGCVIVKVMWDGIVRLGESLW